MKQLYTIYRSGLIVGLLFIQSLLSAQTDSIKVMGLYRSYIVHLPTGYTTAKKYPVVFNLHGLLSNAAQQQVYTNFDAIADTAHFIVVYPNAVGSNWNVASVTTSPSDSLFILELISTLNTRYSVDLNRLYATGFSEGGFMSYVLACMFSERFAAVAVVSGNMFEATKNACKAEKSIPILHIHGTADLIVSWWGIIGLESWVPGTVYWWAQKNNCNLSALHYVLPDPVKSDSSNVELYFYPPGPDSCEVVYIQVNNGGHTWPGASIKLPFGNTNEDFNASSSIWNFFSKHALKGNPIGLEKNERNHSVALFPNPFSTKITLALSTTTTVQMVLYNSLGQEISTIENRQLDSGNYTYDVGHLDMGIYTLSMLINGIPSTRKLIKVD